MVTLIPTQDSSAAERGMICVVVLENILRGLRIEVWGDMVCAFGFQRGVRECLVTGIGGE